MSCYREGVGFENTWPETRQVFVLGDLDIEFPWKLGVDRIICQD